MLVVVSMLFTLCVSATETEEASGLSAQELIALLDYEAAMEDAEYLVETIGVRLTGTQSELAGLDYVEEQYKAIGYETERQDFTLEDRTSGDICIGDMTVAAGTPSKNEAYTGFGEAEGTAVYLSDASEVASLGEDLSGRIVFFDGNFRTARGADGTATAVDADTYAAVSALDAANAEGIVVMMDSSTEETERYQIRVSTPNFKSMGMEISTPVLVTNAIDAEKLNAYLSDSSNDMSVKMNGRSYVNSQNLIATKKAAVQTDKTIYVTCHIDSVLASPGANDNASGVVGVLAMARAFKDIETNYNIQFITFGAEEVGLQGARYFANNLTAQQIEDAIGNYNLDMVATSQENCIYIFMNSSTNPEAPVNDASLETHVTRMSREAAVALGYDTEYYRTCYDRTTDHYALHLVGIPAVEFDWRANAEGTSFEAYYHTRYDDFEHNFSKEKLKTQVDAVMLAVYNDATADYVAVVGEGVYREYYSTMAEAMAAAKESGETIRLMKAFEDVSEQDYFAQAVEWAVGRGIVAGISDTVFAPNMNCTRAQAVSFLWRAAGSPEASQEDGALPFTDVSESDYYYEAVVWALANGITYGTSETTFSPDDTCTRAQAVSFLWRLEGCTEAEDEMPFTDVTESDYYYTAVLWAAENGITAGVTETTFVPNATCTRAQIVSFLCRNAAE